MEINKIYNLDSRNIGKVVKNEVIDVTITSPPYYDLKDYGYDGQIGYGQSYENYLDDLYKVFKDVYAATKSTGTLWVIIDNYRRNDEVVTLPFDFTNKIKDIGWKLQEVIIWEKDKTLPWTHKGQMRNIFEYILVFSKDKNYTFKIDEVRDFESLKKWWIRYPERYNPKGKTPTGIWNFEIPTQGSWGKSYKSHFCPLPEKMIEQIIKITTNENDIVFDPFAGSGTVPSIAHFMKRNYIGFELNKEYISMFDSYVSEIENERIKNFEIDEKNKVKQNLFEKLIINLRVLKYSRLLLNNLKKKEFKISTVFVERSLNSTSNKRFLTKAIYHIFTNEDKDLLINNINEIVFETSLSNFGIEATFHVYDDQLFFKELLSDKKIYSYTLKSTHKFNCLISNEDFLNYPIISDIKVDIDESKYS